MSAVAHAARAVAPDILGTSVSPVSIGAMPVGIRRFGRTRSAGSECVKVSSFRYDRWCGWLLGALGGGRRFSRVAVGEHDVEVRLGLAFRGSVERSSIRSVTERRGRVLGWGAHGWRGRWLVNGSSKGIVVLGLEPPARGRVLGFPMTVRELGLSLQDRDGFVSALGRAMDETPEAEDR